MSLTKRKVLKLGLSAVASIGVSVGCSNIREQDVQALDNPKRDFSVPGNGPLKQRAVDRGLMYGAAGNYPVLSSDPQFAALFAQECRMLVPENEMKWTYLRPTPDRFDFTQADWLAQFARSHKMLLRGHTLVWNQALPEWFKETVNRQNAEQTMVQHIQTVMKHYAGQVHSWDVVNEAISARYSGRPDLLDRSPWLEFLDKNYIELAFRVAAEADPKTMLVYNDRWLDYNTPEDDAQRIATLNLLEQLKQAGTPIHALGIQAHLEGHETRFNPAKFRNFLAEVAGLGLKILITELDVTDSTLPADTAARDRIVAGVYEDYLAAALDEPAVIALLTWGLSDRSTWLSKFSPRKDKAPVRVLPFDSNLKRKLAWNAMARAFDNARQR